MESHKKVGLICLKKKRNWVLFWFHLFLACKQLKTKIVCISLMHVTGMQGLHVKTGTFFLSKQWSHEYQEWLYNWWSTWNINRDPFSLKKKKKSWSVKKSIFFSDIFRFFQSLKIVLPSFSIVDLTSFINYEMVKYGRHSQFPHLPPRSL